MSPIEYIAEGIRQGNWETVCEGYERLTGNALPLPKTKVTDNAGDALRQIADIASSVLDGPIAEICDSPAKPAKKKPGRKRGSWKKTVEKTVKKTAKKKTAKKKAAVTKGGEDPSIHLDDSQKTVVQREAGGSRLITNDPDPEEVERNRAAAERAKKNKVSLGRKATKKHMVKCNECEQMFESDRQGGEMGQKCRSCLSDKKSRF